MITDISAALTAEGLTLSVNRIPTAMWSLPGMRCLREGFPPRSTVHGVMAVFDLVKAVAGHPFKAHREGVDTARSLYEVPVPRRAGVIVASSSPMDIDFYQASKALEMGESAIKMGGEFILVSPCPDGIGNKDLRSFLRIGSQDGILRALKSVQPEVYLVCGIIAYILTRMRERMNITVISGGLSEPDVSQMGFRREESVQLAVDKALSVDGGMIAVFPRGAVTLPKL